jgi:hypothetical protein
LEQQRQAVTTLKAIASVRVVRGGSKRSFDTVGIVFDSRRRLRVEAFGPLGQSLVALVWDGKDVFVRLQDDRIKKPGQAGIERMLGVSIEAKDFCAILSGTVTEIARPQETQAFCTRDGDCVLEFQEGEMVRRVNVLARASGAEVRIAGQELYRSDTLVYRVRYDQDEISRHGLLPGKVVIENPERQIVLKVEYTEAEVNMPVPDDAFTLTDAIAGAGIR